jgi:hypothetical protein
MITWFSLNQHPSRTYIHIRTILRSPSSLDSYGGGVYVYMYVYHLYIEGYMYIKNRYIHDCTEHPFWINRDCTALRIALGLIWIALRCASFFGQYKAYAARTFWIIIWSTYTALRIPFWLAYIRSGLYIYYTRPVYIYMRECVNVYGSVNLWTRGSVNSRMRESANRLICESVTLRICESTLTQTSLVKTNNISFLIHYHIYSRMSTIRCSMLLLHTCTHTHALYAIYFHLPLHGRGRCNASSFARFLSFARWRMSDEPRNSQTMGCSHKIT